MSELCPRETDKPSRVRVREEVTWTWFVLHSYTFRGERSRKRVPFNVPGPDRWGVPITAVAERCIAAALPGEKLLSGLLEKQPAFPSFCFLWVAGDRRRVCQALLFWILYKSNPFFQTESMSTPRHILLIVNNTPEYVHDQETRVQNSASSVSSL